MNYEEALKTELETHLPEMVANAKARAEAAITAQIAESLRWKLSDTIGKAVEEFLVDQVLPEIRSRLLDSKGGIIKSVVDVLPAITGAVGAMLQKRVEDKLSKDWEARAILKALLE